VRRTGSTTHVADARPRAIVGPPALAALLASLVAASAAADPITDREYAIELYEGVAIGDSSQTGMGGAGSARIVGSAGVLLNPAAAVIRRETDNDRWGWDYHLDFLTGRFSSDYDNNGAPAPEDSGAQLVTAGLSVRRGEWAVALTVIAQTAPVDGSAPALDAETARGKLVVARFFPGADLAVGLGIQTVRFALSPRDVGQPDLFAMTGAGGVVGATWLPRGQSYRLAAAVESQIVGNQIDPGSRCDPLDCDGYILPREIESPGRAILGATYRWARTAWNQQVAAKFRDERSVTVSADLVIAGSSSDGHGLEAFGMQQLQRAGRNVTFSPRIGSEIEALPGRLRLRAGTYWEPGRFEGVGGRLHATLGIELRALEISLWGPRRGRLGATIDVASRYRNLGLSLGFWH
jgi:hypothetical protein